MWKKGDHVVHRRDGVCCITGIEELSMTSSGPETYYILTPVYEAGSKLYVPLSRADQLLRSLLTKDDIEDLIRRLEGGTENLWISDEKARQRFLAETVKTGSEENLMDVISTLYEKKKEQTGSGRKFHASDEHFLNEAEKMINREFGFVLGIEPDDVPKYIKGALK